MPSRSVMLVVVAFWLATLGWMIARDLPGENQPPPFKFDLMDEVRGNNTPHKMVQWHAFFRHPDQDKDQDIGVCNTKLNYQPPRMFDLECKYPLPDDDTRKWFFGNVRLTELECHYQVAAARGELLALRVSLRSKRPEFQFRAEVRAQAGSELSPWKLLDQGADFLALATAPSLQTAFNPLHPRANLPGLEVGRTWKVIVIDPLENARPRNHSTQRVHTSQWQAVVAEEQLEWMEKVYSGPKKGMKGFKKRLPPMAVQEIELVYPCWRIDFTDPDDPDRTVRARIWVRQEDDWVLRQEVYYPEGVLKLLRHSSKKP